MIGGDLTSSNESHSTGTGICSESIGNPKVSHSSDSRNQTKSCIVEFCYRCAPTYWCVEDELQVPHKILMSLGVWQVGAPLSVHIVSFYKHSGLGGTSYDSMPRGLPAMEIDAPPQCTEHNQELETNWTYHPVSSRACELPTLSPQCNFYGVRMPWTHTYFGNKSIFVLTYLIYKF